MRIRKRQPWEPVGGRETAESIGLNRRKWLQFAGLAAGTAVLGGTGTFAWNRWRGTDAEVLGQSPTTLSDAEASPLSASYPAPRDPAFQYGREETDRVEAARYTNFYEFSPYKSTWRYVDRFQPEPWTLTVGGLCRRPRTWDLDELQRQFATAFTERQYRFRCVERWAMAIPWTGFPLAELLEAIEPDGRATHVRFISFHRPDQAPQQASDQFPWPYTEGLTLAEATNPLTLLATGIYGRPLLKQHGAPIRLVVPWKYGFKSIKSIERIELVDREPATFWSTLNPDAYPFESNVDPTVPRPWPQHQERMLGTHEIFPTQPFNGYAEYVGHLYPRPS